MQIVTYGDNLYEKSNPIFLEKLKEESSIFCLLNLPSTENVEGYEKNSLLAGIMWFMPQTSFLGCLAEGGLTVIGLIMKDMSF